MQTSLKTADDPRKKGYGKLATFLKSDLTLRHLSLLLCSLVCAAQAAAQTSKPIPLGTAQKDFAEAKTLCELEPLDAVGTVYPEIRISDVWGILEVTKGALVKGQWSSVIVTAPASITGNSLKGDGWTLEFNLGWKPVPGVHPGDYVLRAAPLEFTSLGVSA